MKYHSWTIAELLYLTQMVKRISYKDVAQHLKMPVNTVIARYQFEVKKQKAGQKLSWDGCEDVFLTDRSYCLGCKHEQVCNEFRWGVSK